MNPTSRPASGMPNIDIATDLDVEIIKKQLNREPRGLIGIAARNDRSEPAVIVSNPLIRRGDLIEPFPTLYWLTDPSLCAAISHLERDGVIAQIEQLILEDDEFRAAVHEDHQRYISQRWSLVEAADRSMIDGTSVECDLKNLGVGGVANHDAVKCLHMHVAHHLADKNTIGEWLIEQFNMELMRSVV